MLCGHCFGSNRISREGDWVLLVMGTWSSDSFFSIATCVMLISHSTGSSALRHWMSTEGLA